MTAANKLKKQKSWRDYDRASGYRHISVKPLNGAVGAEITGVDLTAAMSEEVWEEIARAFAEKRAPVWKGRST